MATKLRVSTFPLYDLQRLGSHATYFTSKAISSLSGENGFLLTLPYSFSTDSPWTSKQFLEGKKNRFHSSYSSRFCPGLEKKAKRCSFYPSIVERDPETRGHLALPFLEVMMVIEQS